MEDTGKSIGGILFALLAFVALRPVTRRLPDTDIRKHLLKWVPAILLVGYIKLVEGRDLESVGVEWNGFGPYLRRVVVGTVVMLGANVLVQPVLERVDDATDGIETDSMEQQMATFAEYGLAERAFIALTAGVTEEMVFRGYATERLEELTGSRVVGALVPTGAFVLSHKGEQWDWAAVARIAQPATITTALYLRTRDLLALVTIHALNDLVGLLLADRFAKDE